MLPDLFLPLALSDRRAGGLVARDVPAAVFFYGWPGPAGHLEHAELWKDRLLVRATIHPPITEATLVGLGDARFEAIAAYLSAVGWPVAAPSRPAQVAIGRFAEPPVDLAIQIAPPHGVLARRLEELATEYHIDPEELWFSPISEFLWILRLRQAAEQSDAPTRGLMALPESLRHIGLDEPEP